VQNNRVGREGNFPSLLRTHKQLKEGEDERERGKVFKNNCSIIEMENAPHPEFSTPFGRALAHSRLFFSLSAKHFWVITNA
jgi:hypothetical protein